MCWEWSERNIKQEFNLKSAFGVRQHLRLIQKKGYIEVFPGKSRGIQRRPRGFAAAARAARTSLASTFRNRLTRV